MKMAVSRAIAGSVVGAVLIILGTAMIVEAREVVSRGWGYENVDGIFVYVTWDTYQLAAGIVLALVGTATDAALLTWLVLTRKKKEGLVSPRKRQ